MLSCECGATSPLSQVTSKTKILFDRRTPKMHFRSCPCLAVAVYIARQILCGDHNGMLRVVLGDTHENQHVLSTPQVHRTNTPPTARTPGRSAAHVWVPAGHPRYTRAHFGGEVVTGSPAQGTRVQRDTPCKQTKKTECYKQKNQNWTLMLFFCL